jgi:hypothetical protein
VATANLLVNKVLAVAGTDYFVLTDDDTEFTGFPWAEEMIAGFEKNFERGGVGVLEFVDINECCHILTTPQTVEWLGGTLYDPSYRQFFHDTVLMEQLRDKKKLAYLGKDSASRRMLLHHRDWQGGAFTALRQLREVDHMTFQRRHPEYIHSRDDPRRKPCAQPSSPAEETSPSGSPSDSTASSSDGS